MSIEQAQAFLEKVKNDEDLQKRLKDTQDTESKLEIAKQQGYDFTVEEINSAMDALDEDELHELAGGKTINCSYLFMGYEFGKCNFDDNPNIP